MALHSDLPERYRRADLRLRLFLLGDGSETPGVVRGDEARQRVTSELRHMRDAFAASIEHVDELRAERAEGRVAELEEELRLIAAGRAASARNRETFQLLTVAQAARALGVSRSSVYRAVRTGELRAVRPTGARGGALRIVSSEVSRLLEPEPERDPELPPVSSGSPSGPRPR